MELDIAVLSLPRMAMEEEVSVAHMVSVVVHMAWVAAMVLMGTVVVGTGDMVVSLLSLPTLPFLQP
jgi:hypothetical protein